MSNNINNSTPLTNKGVDQNSIDFSTLNKDLDNLNLKVGELSENRNYYKSEYEKKIVEVQELDTRVSAIETGSKVVPSSENSTKFNGKDYSTARIDMRDGLASSTSVSTAQSTADDAIAKFNSVLDIVYPKGSYYWTNDSTFDPNNSFQGVWERIKDVFLYALGDTGSVNDIGGSKTHKIGSSNLPPHSHGVGTLKTVSSTTGISINTDGAHWHYTARNGSDTGTLITNSDAIANKGSYGDRDDYWLADSGQSWANCGSTDSKGAHSHGVTDDGHTHSLTGSTSDGSFSNTPLDTMPPYITAYCWRRKE